MKKVKYILKMTGQTYKFPWWDVRDMGGYIGVAQFVLCLKCEGRDLLSYSIKNTGEPEKDLTAKLRARIAFLEYESERLASQYLPPEKWLPMRDALSFEHSEG